MPEIDRISHRNALVPKKNLIRPLEQIHPGDVVYIDPAEVVVTHDGMMYLPIRVPAHYQPDRSGLLEIHFTPDREWQANVGSYQRFETVSEVPDGTWFGVDIVTV